MDNTVHNVVIFGDTFFKIWYLEHLSLIDNKNNSYYYYYCYHIQYSFELTMAKT